VKKLLLIFCLLFSNVLLAGGVYQEPDDFISETFPDKRYEKKVLWPNKELKKQFK
jgi:hypothetical protein